VIFPFSFENHKRKLGLTEEFSHATENKGVLRRISLPPAVAAAVAL
jgi:hypothetical protein